MLQTDKVSDAKVICDARAHACHCGLAPLHESFHECADENCGGAWTGDIDGDDFVVVIWPSLIQKEE